MDLTALFSVSFPMALLEVATVNYIVGDIMMGWLVLAAVAVVKAAHG